MKHIILIIFFILPLFCVGQTKNTATDLKRRIASFDKPERYKINFDQNKRLSVDLRLIQAFPSTGSENYVVTSWDFATTFLGNSNLSPLWLGGICINLYSDGYRFIAAPDLVVVADKKEISLGLPKTYERSISGDDPKTNQREFMCWMPMKSEKLFPIIRANEISFVLGGNRLKFSPAEMKLVHQYATLFGK